MANLITEIYDKQAVIDNLNQLATLINSTMTQIVESAPKLQTPTQYLEVARSVVDIEKEATDVTKKKAEALSDLEKLYQQADKARQQTINLQNEEYKDGVSLTNQYKELAKQQKQLIEIERTRQETLANSERLLKATATTEAELRMQQQQLIKASQSLRITNAEENKLREQLIAKINANKDALRDMTNEVSKQKDNIGNYKSALEGVTAGQIDLRAAMALTRKELNQLEALQASGVTLTEEQRKRYNDLNEAMGKMRDIQGDIAQRTKILADDYRNMTFTLVGLKLGVNIMTSLKSVTALLGNDNAELAKTMAQVVAVQQTLNTVSQIQKQLNKDSVIFTNLRLVAERDLTNATLGEVVATKSATVALKALNVARKAGMGLIGIFSAALGGMVKMIKDVFTNEKEATAQREKLNQMTREATDADKIHAEQLQALTVRLQEYKQVLDEIAQSYTVAINKADLFTETSSKQVAMGYFMRQFNAELERYTELSWNYAQKLNQSGVGVQEATKAMNQQREVVQRLAENIRLINAGIGSSETANSFIWAMGQVENAIKNTNAISQQNNKTTEEATKAINKERESMVGELTVAEKLYLLRTQLYQTLKIEAPEIANVTVKTRELGDDTERLNDRLELAILKIGYEYTRALNQATTAEERNNATKEGQRKSLEAQIGYTELMLKTLPQESKEWLQLAKSLEEYKKQLADLAKEQNTKLADFKQSTEQIAAAVSDVFGRIMALQEEQYQEQSDKMEANYERQRALIEATVTDEEEKNKRLAELESRRLDNLAKQQEREAQLKRRKAIFDNAVATTSVMLKVAESVASLLQKETEGDTYSAIARYIAAIAAGAAAVLQITTLINSISSVPAYAKGGIAKANAPFIAGEQGQEIGLGLRTGKVYDFATPSIYRAPEPVNIKNARETRQIINNEYNKDVTLHNAITVKVIDNKRIDKYFK